MKEKLFVPDIILVVMDVVSHPEPAQVLVLGVLLGVEQGLHPLVVKTAGLEEVDDGELVGRASPRVAHSEVEPLCVLHREVVPA